jgi:6-pyruvoyl-tetrahydropterin synthase
VDHAFLNDVIPDAFQPTTAENIASWIANELSTVLPVQSVRLWETPTSWAQVTP